jgi:hypothetical protein
LDDDCRGHTSTIPKERWSMIRAGERSQRQPPIVMANVDEHRAALHHGSRGGYYFIQSGPCAF